MMGTFNLPDMVAQMPPVNLLEKTMSIAFQVPDMTCGHCVKTITGAVNDAVPGAVVVADLPTHRVTITGTDQADKVEAAIRDAGYEPSRI